MPTTTGKLYLGGTLISGVDGIDGRTILSGSGAPSSGTGEDGDFYIDTSASNIYGPKAAGAWGSPTSLIGPAGADGADGADGQTILSGAVDPTTEGVDGDFYLNTSSSTLFGPKASGTWPSGVSLIGSAGVVAATAPITYDAGAQTVAITAATTSAAGSMSAADKTKLDAAVVSDTTGVTGAGRIFNIISLTQAEYDAILAPSATTVYIITAALEDYYGSWAQQNYIWHPESYPPWWA